MNSLSQKLAQKRDTVNNILDRLLFSEKKYPPAVHRAMRHTTFAGGKRLRPVLSLMVGELFDYESKELQKAAASIEMIHTCSLMLDDLPCMDNAQRRRGGKTAHLVFGEDITILAAIALLNRAYQIIFDELKNPDISKRLGSLLTRRVGTDGIIGGQTVDLQAEGEDIDFETLEYIHSHKTGSLFIASALTGGILAGASSRNISALETYSKNLGLAFQITDDILDLKGEKENIGKDTGKDEDKTTFISYTGLNGSRDLVKELINTSIEAREPFGKKGNMLRELARFVKSREK